MPQQIPGYSLPKLTPEQEESLAVQKLLFQYDKPYSQQYQEWGERHPIQQFALEEVAPSLIPGGKIASKLGMRNLGYILEQGEKLGRMGGWGEGAESGSRIAPEYRDPVKKRLSRELQKVPARESRIERWTDESPLLQDTRFKWQQVIEEGGTAGPYELPVFRGGERGTVPGRGTFYAADPLMASSFVRGGTHRSRNRLMNPRKPAEMKADLKQVRAGTLPIDKPLVWEVDRGGRWQTELQRLDDRLDLLPKERRTLAKLLHNEIYERTERTPREIAAGATQGEREMIKVQRYVARLARDRGYDAILRHNDLGDMELVHLSSELSPTTPADRLP